MPDEAKVPKKTVVKKRAPTLQLIAWFKIFKGVLLLLVGLSIFSLANKDLPDLFNRFLEWVNIDPEKKFFRHIGEKLETITPTNIRSIASGTVIYGLFLMTGGIGLSLRARWAVWLAIGESAFFIPIEVYELVHKFSIGLLLVAIVNVVIVWYLLKNRKRLFRHHA